MFNRLHFSKKRHTKMPHLAALFTLLVTAGCMHQPATLTEGIGFRQARHAGLEAARAYRQCRDAGLAAESQAQLTANAGGYLVSARILDRCEAELDVASADIELRERMQAYALSIQSYLKGGDISQARRNLDMFKRTFSGRDLYYPSGFSFISTMEAVLGEKDQISFGQFSGLNVNPVLKREMRRLFHWKNK